MTRNRQSTLALVHGAGRSRKAVRGRLDGGGGQDLGSGRQILDQWRRRHAMGLDHLRSRTQHGLYRHRQRRAVESQYPQPFRRRQSLSRLDRGAERRYRQICLALSGDAGRPLGLHLDPADDPRRHQYRRGAAQGHPARAEERLLLRHRPHQRQVHLGEEFCRCELGDRLRRQWKADRNAGRARRRSVSTRSPARTARTTGIRCRSIRRPASSICRRKAYR